MLKYGNPPYLECSSKGDRRFSAFYARIKNRGNKSIEEIYQGSKLIDGKTGWNWREVKGKQATNQEETTKLYSKLWDEYIEENPELLSTLKAVSGLQDTFGQTGHCCQATELWRIKNRI